jgi:cation-transporting ATPase 13A1
MTGESKHLEDRGEIDLEKKFEPTLLNTAIYLLGLSQQVSTFVLNFQVSCLCDVYIMVKADNQGRPFREGIRENPPLYYGLLGASLVAYSGASEFIPELNSWLQLVKMTPAFKVKLSVSMILDFGLCFIVEKGCKFLFADLEPAEMVTRGRERREKRRALEEKEKALLPVAAGVGEKKTQ